MIRIASIAILLGSFWLASMAIPAADKHRRLDRSVGITLQSDPGARAVNRIPVEYGRLPSEVFGTDEPDDTLAPFAAVAVKQVPFSTIKRQVKIQPSTIALIPLPSHKPQNSQHEAGTVVASLQADWQTVALPVPAAAGTPVFKAVSAPEPSSIDVPLKPAVQPASRLSSVERRRVARHIQRELRRVGCYTGAADGIWGPRSRAAMRAFATKISAAIPTDDPDYVALMLVEKYDTSACFPQNSQPATILADTQDRPPKRIKIAQTTTVAGTSGLIPASRFAGRRTSLGGPALAENSVAGKPAQSTAKPAVDAVPTALTRATPAVRAIDTRAASRVRLANQVQRRRAAAVRAVRSARVRKRRSARRRVARRASRRSAGFSRRGRRAWVRQVFASRR